MGSGTERQALNKKAFASSTVFKALGEDWIYDGNKIAYSYKALKEEVNVTVDFDAEQGRQPRAKGRDTVRVIVRMAKTVRMESLSSYLAGQLKTWDNNCLEAITFLDHLLRELPSQKFTQQKRNFFRRGNTRTLLGGGIEAMKGVYASMRPVSAGISPHRGQLSVNVDVANTTFWAAQPLHLAAKDLLGTPDLGALVQRTMPNRDGSESIGFRLLRRLRKVGVTCTHRKNDKGENQSDNYIIDKFIMKSAQEQKIEFKQEGQQQGTWISIEQYFMRKYNKRLQYPQLPIVKMTKGQQTYIPMEICTITENQRYGFKLSDRQTSEMIKFAVTTPNYRWQDIQHGVNMFEWGQDRYLSRYGLGIKGNGTQPTVTNAKLLPPPKVKFGVGEAVPQYSGRWDLRGKKFIESNTSPLASWGVCVVPDRRFTLDQATVQNFVRTFIRTYEGHGGRVQRKDPVVMQGVNDPAKCVEMLWGQAGNQSNSPPQLLIFIVPNKDAEFYSRIKKSTDCRYGVVSQVLQSVHVQKAQAQYCSNVCMKVNAKLGGATSRAIGIKGEPGWITGPTMYVGADVSHAAPGTEGSSIAAITVSFDRRGLKYAGLVETNGVRVEMITKENWESQFKKLAERWMETLGNKKAPNHLIYFRDGVSEGQYAHVINQEVRDIRSTLKSLDPMCSTKFTVLTATKRHHVRFFPAKGDRNGNPMPGTLVQDGCTAPYEYDFYLCAHSAIKGTARPVHYFVLLDEMNLGQPELQNMIYEASYQYVRSTTPVSLFPAIYYAHLAAARGMSHINQPSKSSGPEDQTKTGSSGKDATEVPKLLDMPNQRGIKGTMWYV